MLAVERKFDKCCGKAGCHAPDVYVIMVTGVVGLGPGAWEGCSPYWSCAVAQASRREKLERCFIVDRYHQYQMSV